MLRHIFILLAFGFLSVAVHAQADAVDRFFSAYEDDPTFSVVYVSPKMFQMIAKVSGEEVEDELLDVINDLRGLKILTTETNTMAVYKDAKAKLNTSDYEVLLTAREEGQDVRFFTKTSGDIVNELLLLVGGSDQFVLMSFVGNLDLNKIAKLAGKLDIEGAEFLGNLEE